MKKLFKYLTAMMLCFSASVFAFTNDEPPTETPELCDVLPELHYCNPPPPPNPDCPVGEFPQCEAEPPQGFNIAKRTTKPPAEVGCPEGQYYDKVKGHCVKVTVAKMKPRPTPTPQPVPDNEAECKATRGCEWVRQGCECKAV